MDQAWQTGKRFQTGIVIEGVRAQLKTGLRPTTQTDNHKYSRQNGSASTYSGYICLAENHDHWSCNTKKWVTGHGAVYLQRRRVNSDANVFFGLEEIWMLSSDQWNLWIGWSSLSHCLLVSALAINHSLILRIILSFSPCHSVIYGPPGESTNLSTSPPIMIQTEQYRSLRWRHHCSEKKMAPLLRNNKLHTHTNAIIFRRHVIFDGWNICNWQRILRSTNGGTLNPNERAAFWRSRVSTS